MNVKKLILCIPTYNTPYRIKDILARHVNTLKKLGIDIYVYDSSDNADTEEVVNEYKAVYEGLIYAKVDSTVHSNRKVYNLYKQLSCDERYDYIWVSSDHFGWTETLFANIQNKLSEDYDAIIVNKRDIEKIGDKIYTDYNELFLECAWHMTMYGATILKRGTMLKDVEWERLEKQYLIPERLNHSHVALYFEQLCRLPQFRVFHMSFMINDLVTVGGRIGATWVKQVFDIWCDYWENMICALPSCYKHKEEVVRSHGLCAGVFVYKSLLYLRIDGILNTQVYFKYRGHWKKYTDVKEYKIFLLSIIPSRILKLYELRKIKCQKKKRTKELIEFCKKYKKLYIYGCGSIAKRYAHNMEELQIEYDGHVVSEKKVSDEKFNNRPIIEMNEEVMNDDNVGIIIALNSGNFNEVMWDKGLIRIKERVFSEYL